MITISFHRFTRRLRDNLCDDLRYSSSNVGYFNKYISQMLPFYTCSDQFLKHVFVWVRFSVVCSFFLVLSACQRIPNDVELIQLHQGAVNAAAFNQHNRLALSIGEDIGIYTLQGELQKVTTLVQPEGIWQLLWVSNDELWIYDRQQIIRWVLSNNELSPVSLGLRAPIRSIVANTESGIVSTETNQLLGITFSSSESTSEGEVLHLRSLQESTYKMGYLAESNRENREACWYTTAASGLATCYSASRFEEVLQFQSEHIPAMLFEFEGEVVVAEVASANPLAGNNEIALRRLEAEQNFGVQNLTQGLSAIVKIPEGLIIGGGNSTWYAWSEATQGWQMHHLSGSINPLKSAEIIAIQADSNSIWLVTSKGQLQVWPLHYLASE
ncbi:MAG: hypothetical protein HLUCCO02_08810 [Idiomarinaceae bacterium HL-53]|nr:MAG: hypothetical protein HLUCCO02_08810 [Idiomarinaceae bacterium HL-53]CUS48393.1 hypothetical protein Ga0003345_1341 [Idiomarinaceae bacterium HL-53]